MAAALSGARAQAVPKLSEALAFYDTGLCDRKNDDLKGSTDTTTLFSLQEHEGN